MIKNKRAEGFLESETLKIVLAVLCIALLLYLGVKLYGLFIKKTASEQASESLNQIMEKINGMKEGESSSFLITSPKGWSIMSSEEQLCICTFGQLGASDFRSEKREDAFRICSESGFCAKIKNKISPYDRCGYGAFESCLDLKNLPLKIYLEKKQGIVLIKTQGEVTGVNALEKILNYKGDGSKTVREIISEFIDVKDEKGVGERIEIGEGIRDIIESYLDTIDVKKEFGYEREELAYSLMVFELDSEGKPDGYALLIAQKYLTFVKDVSVVSSDIKEHKIIFKFWKGAEAPGRGLPSGVF